MTQAVKSKHLVIPNAGIDLGFFQVKVASGRGTSKTGTEIITDLFPSFASVLDAETKGMMALSFHNAGGAIVEVGGTSFFVGDAAMRMLGSTGNLRASSERYALSPTYHALFLGALWQIVKRHGVDTSLTIKHMVLGLPLTTLFEHSDAVEKMATGKHVIPSPFGSDQSMTVIVEQAMVVAQPQGGIFSYAHGAGRTSVAETDDVLVMDMGGGTFDWFLCDGKFQPSYKFCGALPTGTLNIASEILKNIKPSLINSPRAMLRVDTALRDAGEFKLADITYKIDDFASHTRPLIEGAIDQMRSKVGELDSLNHILLTGGGARHLESACKDLLENFKGMIRIDPDPVYSNVKGFYGISETMTS